MLKAAIKFDTTIYSDAIQRYLISKGCTWLGSVRAIKSELEFQSDDRYYIMKVTPAHSMYLSRESFLDAGTVVLNFPQDLEALDIVFAPPAPKFTFGGAEVIFKYFETIEDVTITCKGVSGTFSELIKIRDEITGKTSNRLSFGTKTLTQWETKDGIWTSDYNTKDDELMSLTIGCTTGTYEEFTAIINEAFRILVEHGKDIQR